MSEDYTDSARLLKGADIANFKDVYGNQSLDLGFGTTDPTLDGVYPRARSLTWNLQRIESVLRADPFFRRALEYRSSEPVIHGADIASDEIDSEDLSKFRKEVQRKIFPAIKDALFEADAFGWSGMFIMIEGQNNKREYKRPLRLERIPKDSFLGIKTLTRWYQINPSHEMIEKLGKETEIYDPQLLGTPKIYKVGFTGQDGNLYDVHRSRLLVPARNKQLYIEKKIEHYGGTSLLEQAFDSMSRYHSLVGQIHRILNKAVIPILKLEDMVASGMQNEKAQQMVQDKINMMRKNLSNSNLFVIGDSDSLTFEQANLAGLDKQLAEARLQVASALEVPPHILFREKQEYDEDEVDGFIRTRQEFEVRDMLEKLLPILYKSMFGKEIPDYEITFKPLDTPSQLEKSQARKENMEALSMAYEMGAYNTKSVQKAIRDIDTNPTDIFRNIDPEYVKHIEGLDVNYGHLEREIELAVALNKQENNTAEEKLEGKHKGGDPTKKQANKSPVKKKGEEV